MVKIDIPDMNDVVLMFKADDVMYGLRFTYNDNKDYWNFGVYDYQMNPLITMTRIVPNYPLLYPFTSKELPKGDFFCVTSKTNVGRETFLNNDAKFIYVTEDELIEMGAVWK